MSVTCKVILPHDLERNDTLGEKEWGHGEKRKLEPGDKRKILYSHNPRSSRTQSSLNLEGHVLGRHVRAL